MKLLQWFAKIVLTVMLVSSLTLLTTGLIVQSYVKSLLASFNIEWEGQPLGLTSMFQGHSVVRRVRRTNRGRNNGSADWC